MKVIIYLCEEHSRKVLAKEPMTDDVVVCQVPTCFSLATWKYFTDIKEELEEVDRIGAGMGS